MAASMVGCVNHPEAYTGDQDIRISVIRITEEKDASVKVSVLTTPPTEPTFCREIRFRVTDPVEFRGREIVLPIILETEGPLFSGKAFAIRVPPCVLRGTLTEEHKNPDGTIHIIMHTAFSFEGILDKSPNQAPAPSGSGRGSS